MYSLRFCAKSALMTFGLLLLCGCGSPGPDYGSLDLSDADGRVTLDGEPLADALVLFEDQTQSFSFAITDDGGRYRMMFNSEKSGVTKGQKTVRIWSSRGVPGMAEEDPDAKPKQAERVPTRYNTRSELTAMVEDDSHTFDFDLTSS